MKKLVYSLMMVMAACAAAAVPAAAQGNSFASPDVDYAFDLPDARWKMTVKPSATTPNVEYVFGDRTEGHFEVRRLSVAPKSQMSDVVKDEEQKLQFMPGYVAGKEEQFGGYLKGLVFNFEFVRAGRPMSGRFYFLRASDNTVYVIRFTGYREPLRLIRAQTDGIARSFKVKAG